MKTVKQLKDERGVKIDALNAITTLANTEVRELKPEEETQFNTLDAEIRALDTQIKTAEIAEQRAAEAAAAPGKKPVTGKEDNEQKRQNEVGQYSILRAVRSLLSGQNAPLDGLELEMHQEALTEAKRNQTTINGVGIPSMVTRARTMEKRDNSIQMPTQPEDGSILVQTDKRISLDDMLRNALMTVKLGATYYNDLVGNVDFVRMTQRPVATWKPEVANLDKSNVKFGKVASISPKRVGTFTVHSKQFLLQTAPSVETQIRQELAYAIAEGIDKAAIYGDGVDNEPKGILHADYASLISTIALGATGATLTRANTTAALIKLLAQNVNGRNLGWLMNALTAGSMMDTPIASGSDKFLMESLDSLRNYPVAISNAVKGDNTKSSGTNLSDLIFGAWENLYIAQWGGYDLTVDNITLATAGQVQLIIQAFADVAVYEPKAFVAFRDVKTS